MQTRASATWINFILSFLTCWLHVDWPIYGLWNQKRCSSFFQTFNFLWVIQVLLDLRHSFSFDIFASFLGFGHTLSSRFCLLNLLSSTKLQHLGWKSITPLFSKWRLCVAPDWKHRIFISITRDSGVTWQGKYSPFYWLFIGIQIDQHFNWCNTLRTQVYIFSQTSVKLQYPCSVVSPSIFVNFSLVLYIHVTLYIVHYVICNYSIYFRWTYEEFYDRYRMIIPSQMVDRENYKETCRYILEKYIQVRNLIQSKLLICQLTAVKGSSKCILVLLFYHQC